MDKAYTYTQNNINCRQLREKVPSFTLHDTACFNQRMAAKYNAMYKSLVQGTMTPETPQMGLSGVKPCVARNTPSQSDSRSRGSSKQDWPSHTISMVDSSPFLP